MNRITYDKRVAKLSKVAAKTLNLIEQGRYYRVEWHGQRRKVIQELIDAGLITDTMRPMVFVRAYVPTSGYTPAKHEIYRK